MTCPQCSAEVPHDKTRCPGCEADVGWRVRRWDGVTYGPYDERSLRLFAREGRIALSDYCQQGPEGAWVPIQQVIGAVSFPPPLAEAPAQVEGAAAAPASARGRSLWIIGCVVLVLLGLGACAAVLVSAYRQARQLQAQSVGQQCLGNLSALGTAMSLYLADNDGRFPTGVDWEQPLTRHVANPTAFRCPAPPPTRYVFNDRLQGRTKQDVADETACVAAYDGPLAQGGRPRHPSGNGALYVDGHASVVPRGGSLQYTLDPAAHPNRP
jgi:prepilin-type processing-associated H-X9-DG protein